MSTKPEEKEEEPQETNRARIEKQYKAHRALQGDPVPEDTGREGTSPENPEYLPENLNKQAPEGKVPQVKAVPASKQAVEEPEHHKAEAHKKH